ncbi:MAG: hypothetical protein Q8W46_08275, partial [Candidatus Palauibacterales bacterium]|nr:hypothetical protein [Candidatus Palauibacterales bacterium]
MAAGGAGGALCYFPAKRSWPGECERRCERGEICGSVAPWREETPVHPTIASMLGIMTSFVL